MNNAGNVTQTAMPTTEGLAPIPMVRRGNAY